MLAVLSIFLGMNLPQNCAPIQFATRTARPNCWVKLDLGPQKQICVSDRQWIQWLQNPGPICSVEDSFLRLQKARLEKPSQNRLFLFLAFIEKKRELLSQFLQPYDRTGVFRSLLVNENSSQDAFSVLRKLGFVHLVSTSGIHLYVIAKICDQWICRLCKVLHIPVLTGLWISRIFSFGFNFWIWLLSGARLGMLRPALVILAKSSARSLGFQWQKFSPLFLALGIEMIWEIFLFFQTGAPGFHSGRWSYALAVGGGMYFYSLFPWPHFGLAVGSWIGAALFEVWHTGTVALFTPVLSYLTLPWICSLVYPGLLIAFLLSTFGFYTFSCFILQKLSYFFHFSFSIFLKFAFLPGNLWAIPKEFFFTGMIFSSVLILFWVKRNAFLVLILPSLLIARIFSSRNFQILQLDVGQGDAALVLTDHQTGLIDAGSFFATRDSKWIQTFATQKVSELSWIFLTHLDEDHSGGSFRIARIFPVRCIVVSSAELETSRGLAFSRKMAKLGVQVEASETSQCIPFSTYSPTHRFGLKTGNQNMGAIWIPLPNDGFYLSAGDASENDENQIEIWASKMSKNYSGPRILKISHHGSRFSTGNRFLKKLRPTEAWISVGRYNHYGHPSVSVLKKLDSLNIPIHRTDRDGEISFTTKGAFLHRLLKHLR